MTPYLALASKLEILQTKACNRAELEAKQISHTTATKLCFVQTEGLGRTEFVGRCHGQTGSRKVSYRKAII